MTKMAATPIYSKTLKNLLLQSQWTDCNEIGYVASRVRAYHNLFILWPWADIDLFYAKVRFGHLSLYMGYLKVGTYIELNDLLNLHEYQRSRSFFDLSQRLLGFSKLNPFFSETVELIWTKYYAKDFGSIEMKICINGLGRMTMRPPRPYMVKTLQKSFSPESEGRWQCNLVCSI